MPCSRRQHPAPAVGDIHGLNHPPDLLQQLPVMLPRPPPHQPIRALGAAQFAQMHLRHLLSHPPDAVLFPFLHGVEGDNDAQNIFFASTSGAAEGALRVPRFRGLVWVAADDDDALDLPCTPDSSDEELDDDYSDFDIDADAPPRGDQDAFGVPMDVDVEASDPNDANHMHPIYHRAAGAPSPGDAAKEETPIPTPSSPVNILDYTYPYGTSNASYSPGHDRRDSNASYTTTSSVPDSLFDSESVSTSFSSAAPETPIDGPCMDQLALASEQTIKLPLATSPSPPPRRVPILTSTFRPRELLRKNAYGFVGEFLPPRVPDGISLRNFGIQVPVYATLSDIVVYSPCGDTRAAFTIAEKFKRAVEAKVEERRTRAGLEKARFGQEEDDLIAYNVFVLDATPQELEEHLPHLVIRTKDEHAPLGEDGPEVQEANGSELASTLVSAAGTASEHDHRLKSKVLKANTISFAQREKDEMRELTRSSEIVSIHPLAVSDPANGPVAQNPELHTPFSGSTPTTLWDPSVGQIFLGNSNDVPVPPSDDQAYCPHPSAPAEFLAEDDADPFNTSSNDPAHGFGYDICIECHDVVPFPSSAHLRAAEEHIAALDDLWAERCAKRGQIVDGKIPVRPPPNANSVIHLPFPSSPPSTQVTMTALMPFLAVLERMLMPVPSSTDARPARTRTASSGSLPCLLEGRTSAARTRPVKVLIYSSDGYTESSVLALSTLMYLRGLSLPEAYLELQVTKRRSFFVYGSDVGVLKRIDQRVQREREKTGPAEGGKAGSAFGFMSVVGAARATMGRPAANSVSSVDGPTAVAQLRRPRASTSPVIPSLFSDHQAWFNDPRFDGSFPSRVLPFLYLGNLNHASNAYMLHALGITHVVSVGECALVPPPGLAAAAMHPSVGPQFVPGKGPGSHGSLWIEEREGRIKVLDIKGVCDDGIDTLEHQLEPICDWIDKARADGGQVLVHCRVGVSRSATVVIAYVMKHLNIPLVDAYLIVRSRRLSVLIQPNLRLLYNLQGWEVKLAIERAGGEEGKLQGELARALNWPYLSKEVHALNEKYLH